VKVFSMIEAQSVSKTFVRGEAGSVEALKNVSLRIAPGEFVVVRGASGSGKSTLLNILGCLDPPTRGRYRLDGEDVARYDDKQLSRLRNAKIGFIFQSFKSFPLKSWIHCEATSFFWAMVPKEIAIRKKTIDRIIDLSIFL